MWQDRPSETRLRRIADRLRSVLPAPQAAAARETAVGVSADPEQVAGLLRAETGFVWHDGGPERQRFYWRPLAVLSAFGGRVTASGPRGVISFSARAFDLIEAALAAWGDPPGAALAGFIGYDLVSELEDVPRFPRRDFPLPDLWLALYDASLDWRPTGWRLSSMDGWRGADRRIARTLELLKTAKTVSLPADTGTPLSTGPVRSRPSAPDYAAGVARIVSRIFQGDFFQTNFCRRLECPLEEEAIWPFYLRMRRISSGRYGAFLNIAPGTCVLSVSPELFLNVAGRVVETRPIKGTRPRGQDPETDRALAAALRDSEKDRAELAMIVDVARNDLGRVCAPGSVKVERHAELSALPTVHHTSSTVSGRLREGAGLGDLLRAVFPPASITGAPKIEAIKASALEEGRRRGPCMGSIGWISLDGALEMSVAIRTAVAARGRVFYHTGAGITAGSEPEQELEETSTKALAFLRALGLKSL